MDKTNDLIIHQNIDTVIYIVREQKVMLDQDLASVYGVATKVLNQAIRRNKERFPEEFMFQLSVKEYTSLRSRFVTSKRGGRRYMPFVFTEHGAVMLATVLKSQRAVKMSIEVVKAFVRLSQTLASHKDVVNQLAEIRSFMLKQSNKADREFRKVWNAIEKLATTTGDNGKQSIGFKID